MSKYSEYALEIKYVREHLFKSVYLLQCIDDEELASMVQSWSDEENEILSAQAARFATMIEDSTVTDEDG